MERSLARLIVVSVMLGLLAAFLPACASTTGGSIEVEELKESPEPAPAASGYTIGIGDTLNVQVWDQEKMTAKVRVRSDGRISYPFLNDVEAAGKTPVQLAHDLEIGLKSVILDPRVTVGVDDSKPQTLNISVLGAVTKPGLQMLEPGAGVAQALAAAGGLTVFAHQNRIYVVRAGPPSIRIHFSYDTLTRSTGKALLFRLRSGDVVVVE